MMLALSIKRVTCEVLFVCFGIYEHFREVLVVAFYRLCAEETLDYTKVPSTRIKQ